MTKVWNELMTLQEQEMDKLVKTLDEPSSAYLLQAGVVDGIFKSLKQVSTLFAEAVAREMTR